LLVIDFYFEIIRITQIKNLGGKIIMIFPEELKYSKEHEWAKLTDNHIIVGITDFAQSELGDIVYVELPNIGAQVFANEKFGEVESVKSVSNLYSPVNGKIIEVNDALSDSPQLVNEAPYTDGWMIKVKPDADSGFDKLLTADEYKKLIGQ